MSDSGPNEGAPPSRFGKFIQAYSGFLSSFVIGVAGLIATSTYQYSQSQVASRQADAQQKIAETQAENQWKIERAKILSQNLNVLATQGGGNVEQRYGVLLSLTRGNILDPELAVSYALELGKDNPDYMRVVLANTGEKEYRRLASAFVVTCEQRFGVSRAVELCRDDRLASRSAALAELISDEVEVAMAAGRAGPLALLRDDREAQALLLKLLWLFAPVLDDMFDRRQWEAIQRFEAVSSTARLIAALSLLSAHNGDLVSAGEAAQIERAQGERRAWLAGYLISPACEADCKGKVASIILTGLAHAPGQFEAALRALLDRPRTEVVTALNRLNRRLLHCQVDGADAAALRDRVIVPELSDQLKAPKADPALVEDLIGLLAVGPEPQQPAPDDRAAQTPYAAWTAVLGRFPQVEGGRYQRAWQERRAATRRLRQAPPAAMRKLNFCNAAEALDNGSGALEE